MVEFLVYGSFGVEIIHFFPRGNANLTWLKR